MKAPRLASVDPPELAAGAWSDRAPEATNASGGGAAGFITEPAWSLVLGDGPANEEALGDLRHLQHLLEEYPEAEPAMQLQVLNQLRAALNQVGLDADAETPVAVPAWVLVLAARKLTRALR